MTYSYLISDELAELYLNYKKGKEINSDLLELFFSFYEATPFITIEQWDRYDKSNTAIRQSLMASGYSAKSEQQILDETKYKIKLTTNNNNYPCVNIKDGYIKRHFVVSYKVNESRSETINHLKNLFKEAKSIVICDNYMFTHYSSLQDVAIVKFFKNILNNEDVTVFYKTKEPVQQEIISHLKTIKPKCTIKPCSSNLYKNVHDRYLLIDNKLEVILSSGIDYLFDTSKEISIIYRGFW